MRSVNHPLASVLESLSQSKVGWPSYSGIIIKY